MRKIFLKTIACAITLLFGSSICLGVLLDVNNKQNHSNTLIKDDKKKILFDGKEFNNIDEAYNYALSYVNEIQTNVTNKKTYSLSFDDHIETFNSIDELNDFINGQIKIIENCSTNLSENNLDPADNSIYLNDMYKYNVNVSNNEIYENNNVNIYKKNGGGYVIEEDNNSDEAIKKAKESYLEIHKAYYFNGIYFKSKQDLEIYIRKIYKNKFVNDESINVNNKRYKKIFYIDETGNKIYSEPIDFSRDESYVLNDINNFINQNNYQYLKINSLDGPKYLKYDKLQNQIIGNIGETISIIDLPILKKMNNDNKSLYVIDSNITEEYELYGPYFLNTDAPIENITNPNSWKVCNDEPYEIVRSQSISLLSSFLDLFLTDINERKYFNGSHEPLFYISEINNEIYELEEMLFDDLSKINTSDNSNLSIDLLQMFNNLKQTKSYSTIFAIPAIYTFLKDQLIINQAPPSTIILFQSYFDVLCKNIQTIFESIFGDLLNEFNNKNGERFNFAKFFGINQYGFDNSNIGSVLNGYDLIKRYKPLVAGCYVFMKAIANTQNTLIFNYNSINDNYLFNLLEDGKNFNQMNSSKVKTIFKENGICEKLDVIYKTFSNWSKIIENEISLEIDKSNLSDNKNANEKLDVLGSFLIKYKNSNSIIPSTLFEEFIQMQNVVNVKDEYKIKNEDSRSKKMFRVFLEESFNSKRKSNVDFKINSINQAKLFINNKNNLWTSKNGVLFLRGNLSKNYADSISLSSYNDIILQSSIINQINQTKKKDIMDIFEIAEKIAGRVEDIASEIINLSKKINDPKFNEVKDQIIASGIISICSSVSDIISNITIPPINIIAKAASLVFSFISSAIGDEQVKIYEYQVNDSSGSSIKYYWDGGLVMNRFWGLWKDNIRDINDLKMQSPIQLIRNQNMDTLYFNGKNYEIEDDGIAKKDAIEYILNSVQNDDFNYDSIKTKFSWVYSLEPNVKNISEQNSFENKLDLARYAMENNKTEIDGEIFLDGYEFVNLQDLEENLNKHVLEVINPFYIAKIPELNEFNYPIDEQSSYHIPYPYFEPSNQVDQQLICAKNVKMDANLSLSNDKIKIQPIQDQKYIIYDSNSNSNSAKSVSKESTINDIFTNIKNRFYNTFDVESKTILRTNLIDNEYKLFDNFKHNLQFTNIYYVENNGRKKYFLNKLDAEKYILHIANNSEDIILNVNKKKIYEYKNENITIKFETIGQFNKWFIQEVK